MSITFEDVNRVVAHGLSRRSRGRRFSATLGKEKNPQRAFLKALEMSKEFNRHFHPECGADEVFIGNCDDDVFHEHIDWKTKRQGYVAYTNDGQEIKHPDFTRAHIQGHILDSLNFPKPVFVKRGEIERRSKFDDNYRGVLDRLISQAQQL